MVLRQPVLRRLEHDHPLASVRLTDTHTTRSHAMHDTLNAGSISIV